mmetsp:Transcript_10755/g.37647  ORF Transcript_10755/g.37647 Transcript_10755/m.37647 type:complete len:232 (+) Transcript_10755:306-1001(+)
MRNLKRQSVASFVSGSSALGVVGVSVSRLLRCFLPRTSFKRPDRLGGGRITAAQLNTTGGDIVLGAEGNEVTVLRAQRHSPSKCQVAFMQTQCHSYPFQITVSHRIVVEASDGHLETMTVEKWFLRDPKPRIYDGRQLHEVVRVWIDELATEIVEVTFAEDAAVLAWVLPKRACSSRPPLRANIAVACRGARLRPRDIRVSEGDLGLGIDRTFLCARHKPEFSKKQRSLSA